MIKVDSLDHKGRGISKLNGKIVFIENALPNEIVDIKIIKEKKKYIEAHISKIINESDKRIKPICPYFYECGGCDLMHLSYNNQLEFKQNKIKNIIYKYLKKDIKINNIVKCSNNLHYRNKVTFQVREKLGFYKKNSYEIIDIDKCYISNEKINNSINFLKELDLKNIIKIICKTNNEDLMIILEVTNENIDITPIKQIANSIYIKIKDNYKLIYGENKLNKTIGQYNFLVSPDSFFQVNDEICIKLYKKIKSYIEQDKNILDLFCGTGTIGIFVNENNKVLGVEINKNAIIDANQNKKINDINNIEFLCGDSGKTIQNINFKPDIVIVDPPRSGLDKISINNIIKLNPQKIIYVSCDPMTLVRDLNELSNSFEVEEITPFDMFPNTNHVECIALLIKNM